MLQNHDYDIFLAEEGIRIDLASLGSPNQTRLLPQLRQQITKRFQIVHRDLIFLRSDGQPLKSEGGIGIADQLLPDRKLFVFNKGFHKKGYTGTNIPTDPANFDLPNIEESFIALEKQISTSSYEITSLQYKEKLGTNYNQFIQNKELKGLLKRLEDQFGKMKGQFTQVTNEIKFLNGSVKVQRQVEEVAKLNLQKQIDEKSIFLEKTTNDLREEFTGYLNCIQNVEMNVRNLQSKKLKPREIFRAVKGETLAKYFPVKKLVQLAKSSERKKIRIFEISKKAKGLLENFRLTFQQLTGKIDTRSTKILLDEITNSVQDPHGRFWESQEQHFHEFSLKTKDLQTLIKFLKDEAKKFEGLFLDFSISLQNLQSKLGKIRAENLQNVVGFIQEIHGCQGKVKEKMRNKFMLIKRHSENFKEAVCFLKIVEDFPDVHKAAMKEVGIRLISKKHIQMKFQKFEQHLRAFENTENTRRQRFTDKYGPSLPVDYLPFLANQLPQVRFDPCESILSQDVPDFPGLGDIFSQFGVEQSILDESFEESQLNILPIFHQNQAVIEEQKQKLLVFQQQIKVLSDKELFQAVQIKLLDSQLAESRVDESNKQEVMRVQSDMTHLRKQNQILSQEIQLLQRETHQQKTKITDQESQNRKQQENLRQNNEMIEALNTKHQNRLQQCLQENSQTIQQLKKQMSEQKEEMTKQLKSQDDETRKMGEEIQQYEVQIQELSASRIFKQKFLEKDQQLKTVEENLRKELKQLEATLKQEQKTKHEDVNSLQSELDSVIDEKILAKRAQIDQKNEIKALILSQEEMEAEIKLLTERILKIKQQYSNDQTKMKETHFNEIQQIQSQIQLQPDSALIITKNKQLMDQLVILNTKTLDLQKAIGKLRTEKDLLVTGQMTLKRYNSQLKKAVSEKEIVSSITIKKMDGKMNDHLKQIIQKANSKILSLQNQLKDYKQKIDEQVMGLFDVLPNQKKIGLLVTVEEKIEIIKGMIGELRSSKVSEVQDDQYIIQGADMKQVKDMLLKSSQPIFKQIFKAIDFYSQINIIVLIQLLTTTIDSYLAQLQNSRITMQQPFIGDMMMFFVLDHKEGKMMAIHDGSKSFHAFAYDQNGIITKRSGHELEGNTFYLAKIVELPGIKKSEDDREYNIYKYMVDPKSFRKTIIQFGGE